MCFIEQTAIRCVCLIQIYVNARVCRDVKYNFK